jgi:predicted flap endonuclease-1-like 5' DNA nuclease
VSRDKDVRARQLGQDSRGRTDEAGQLGQDSRTEQSQKTVGIVPTGQETEKAWPEYDDKTEQPAWDNLGRTIGIGPLEQDSRDRSIWRGRSDS